MTNRELNYQYRLAALFLDTARENDAITHDQYVADLEALARWYHASSAAPDTAEPIQTAPLLAALGWDDASNIIPLPMGRLA